ncbi:MAG TPA: type III polyketide synthase [Actinomycetales bacterium]|nr:type III polyketide synthase [Actinomycetales bacterium]
MTVTEAGRRAADVTLTGPAPAPAAAVVTGLAHAVPAPMAQDDLWRDYFAAHYADNPLAARVWRTAGIERRHGVVNPAVEDISLLGTGARMARFVAEAMPLGQEAVGAALASAGLHPEDVGLFGVVSCTGYATPGLDILLARDLGMHPDVQRLVVGHMGCYAALPGLGTVSDFVVARSRPAVLLCLELTSLHVQPPSETSRSGSPTEQDLQQMVAHALFSDAAAAVVVEPRRSETGTTPSGPWASSGLRVVDVVARTDVSTSELMTWDVTDLGFRMGLSPKVPEVLAKHVLGVVTALLGRNGLSVDDVAGWAVHPGGRRILEVVQERLGLDDQATTASYDVLRDYGNCSSATVLLVLEQLQRTQDLTSADPVVALAFGPGLTLYATLLRVV